jgi:hypothetical protein
MRSYSFDSNFDQTAHKSNINALFIKEELKWISLIMLIVALSALIFRLYFNFISIAINLFIIGVFLNLLYVNFLQKNHTVENKKMQINYLSIVVANILNILELIMIGSFYLNSFDKSNSINDFQIYFAYMNLFYIIFRTGFLTMFFFNFRKEF